MQLQNSYVRLTKSVTDFGKLIPALDILDESKLQQHLKTSPLSDWYTSLYYFGPEAKEHFDKQDGSIKGYDGPAYTDKLVFDFDSKEDIEIARKDAVETLNILNSTYGIPEDAMRAYFSGNKGFHVEVYTNNKYTPDEVKAICTNIAGHLSSFDTVIYNTTRPFRLNNTINLKSNLYKIELELADLQELTIDQIRAKAKVPIKLGFSPVPTSNTKALDVLKDAAKLKPVVGTYTGKDIAGIRGLDTINYDACPKPMPRCLYALSHGVMQSGGGERNALFLRLAAYYRGQGMTKQVALSTLEGVAAENAKLYPEHDAYTKEELEHTVVNSVFGSKEFKQIPGATGLDPNNEMVKRYCDAVGQFTTRKCCVHHRVDRETTVQIDQVSDSFDNFATHFDKNTVKTGINFIDDHMNIAVGTTTLLVGSTGAGKTTLALNILENSGALDQHAVFFSMDMNKNLVYLKLAQKVTHYKQHEILDFYKTKNTAKITEIRNKITEKYKKVFFDFNSTLTIEAMRDTIFRLEEQHKVKIKLVLVDYAGRMSGPYSDTFANANYNALQSTGIASLTDTAWLLLSQISRNMGDGSTPLRTKRAAKESGTWEESATNVITVWRPFIGDSSKDDVIRIYLAKNRMGRELEQIFHWDGAKGEIRDMDYQELADYNAVREKEEREYLRAKANKL